MSEKYEPVAWIWDQLAPRILEFTGTLTVPWTE